MNLGTSEHRNPCTICTIFLDLYLSLSFSLSFLCFFDFSQFEKDVKCTDTLAGQSVMYLLLDIGMFVCVRVCGAAVVCSVVAHYRTLTDMHIATDRGRAYSLFFCISSVQSIFEMFLKCLYYVRTFSCTIHLTFSRNRLEQITKCKKWLKYIQTKRQRQRQRRREGKNELSPIRARDIILNCCRCFVCMLLLLNVMHENIVAHAYACNCTVCNVFYATHDQIKPNQTKRTKQMNANYILTIYHYTTH